MTSLSCLLCHLQIHIFFRIAMRYNKVDSLTATWRDFNQSQACISSWGITMEIVSPQFGKYCPLPSESGNTSQTLGKQCLIVTSTPVSDSISLSTLSALQIVFIVLYCNNRVTKNPQNKLHLNRTCGSWYWPALDNSVAVSACKATPLTLSADTGNTADTGDTAVGVNFCECLRGDGRTDNDLWSASSCLQITKQSINQSQQIYIAWMLNPWNILPPTVSFTSLSSFRQTIPICNVDFSGFVSCH